MSIYQLKNDHFTLEIASFGAEMKSLKSNKTGQEYLWCADPQYWGRTSPILFPLVGKYKDNKTYYKGMEITSGQHGFARDTEFEFVSQTEDTIWFALKSNEDTFAKYPFHFVLHVGYQLIDNKVKVMWKVENPDDNTLYFSIGAHPAFNCPLKEGEKLSDYFLLFDTTAPLVSQKMGTDGFIAEDTFTVYPTDGKLAITNDLFAFNTLMLEKHQTHRISLLTPEGKEYVAVSFDAPLVAVWSPIEKNAPFICIEPWYGRSDRSTFNQQLTEREYDHSLEKDQVFTADYTIEIND
jgi:galactose mutarotase-like enzyme